MKRLLTCMLVLFCFGMTKAQVATPGTPASQQFQLKQKIQEEVMPSFDVEAMKAEDEIGNQKGFGSYRFAYTHDVKITPKNSGTWDELPNGDRVWRVKITSFDAYSLNVIFKHFRMPEGAEMYVYNEDRSYQIGAFTSFNNKEDGGFAIAPVAGESIIIEYYEPAAVRHQGLIHISKVNHDYVDIGKFAETEFAKGFGDSGACNNNVNCPEGNPWINQINSVAIILIGGSGACTGAVVNNTNQDLTPYFLTANHCGIPSGSSVVYAFNYQSPSCTPNVNGNFSNSVTGGTVRANFSGSDMALLELSVMPPEGYNVFYAGWDNSGAVPGGSVCVHHPSGDVKKISFDINPAGTGTFGGATCWRIFTWEDGTTEPGSSGSPLFDDTNGRIIGQLFGGTASCGNNIDDFYGKMSTSWTGGGSNSTRLSNWLDPSGSGVTTLDGQYSSAPDLAYNLAASSIASPAEGITCDPDVVPEVQVTNLGSETITSFTVTYSYDMGSPSTYNWTGSITTFQSASITLPSATLALGIHTFEYTVSLPNGNADENNANDTQSRDFEVISGLDFTVNLTTDDFPEETSYEILDGNNQVVYASSGFGAEGTLFSDVYCLPEGCYTWVIYDTYNDGICCGFGNGGYQLLDNNGIVIATGGQFGASEAVPFCLSSSSLVANFTVDPTVCLGDDVLPNDLSVNATAWTWDTPGADQNSYSGQTPAITYSTAGMFTITLTVTDDSGNSSVTSRIFEVVNATPIGTMAGPTTSSPGAQNTYAVVPVSGGFWTWTITGGSQVSGGNSNIISVVWDQGATQGEVCVVLTNANGCDSDPFCRQVDLGTTGIEEVIESTGLQLFPNPTADFVNVIMDQQAISIEVFDLMGRMIVEINNPQLNNQIPMPEANGIYLVRVRFEEGIATQKVIVNRP